MNKNNVMLEFALSLDSFERDIRKVSELIFELVRNDRGWWQLNICSLVSQPLISLKQYLNEMNDTSLIEWDFRENKELNFSILEPIEALVWLAALCRVDKILIGVLPRRFVDDFELQWKVIALYWIK